MIKQILWKTHKMAFGFLNTYIRKKGQMYDDTKWWDGSFYKGGISDRQTISQKKSVITAKYHYASMELLILKHLRNTGKQLNQANLLDIGSGSGHWIDFYKTLEVASVSGIDVSHTAFQYLTQKYYEDIRVKIHEGKALELIETLNGYYDIVNAVGVMFHIVDDAEWERTILSIANVLKDGGLFIVGGHFGFLDGLNVQINKNGGINKRLRSKSRWTRTLKKTGFRDIKIHRNNAYLWINDTLPENNVLVATK